MYIVLIQVLVVIRFIQFCSFVLFLIKFELMI